MEKFLETTFIKFNWLALQIQNWLTNHLISVLVILFGAWFIRKLANNLIDRLLRHIVRPDIYATKSDREKRVKTLGSLVKGVVRLGIYIVTSLLIISELYPDIRTTLFTSAGIFGVVIGFGAQSLIKDLTSGIFIIAENQYRIGDDVTLSAGMGLGKIEGTVEDLTIRTTVLRDLSGNVHHIPNGNIGVTTNKTLGFSQMNEDITVHFDTNLDKFGKIIEKIGQQLQSQSQIRNQIITPPYLDSIIGFTDKGISVRVLAKTNAAAQWETRSEFYRLLQQAMLKNNIKVVGQLDNNKK